jgi:hypothetical protein
LLSQELPKDVTARVEKLESLEEMVPTLKVLLVPSIMIHQKGAVAAVSRSQVSVVTEI